MNNVENPIIIDQQYCPEPNCLQVYTGPLACPNKRHNIQKHMGVSSTKVAVKFECSKSSPCKNVVLTDINLSYNGVDDVTISECPNLNGASYGRHSPTFLCIILHFELEFFFFFFGDLIYLLSCKNLF
ncbi:hypothetical protein Patl1_05045 [Pistacia atlantica]|uniref:Uncharacterized protein n=1 Tax=Pistacia atlantica TaxID=434234 RepID=A0ACC1BX16_9ROSI|nr:hypothetical protein Patl1_05045 [Pistacia atlantica]